MLRKKINVSELLAELLQLAVRLLSVTLGNVNVLFLSGSSAVHYLSDTSLRPTLKISCQQFLGAPWFKPRIVG